MTLESDYKPDIEELKFTSEMGWLATLAIAVATVAPFIINFN